MLIDITQSPQNSIYYLGSKLIEFWIRYKWIKRQNVEKMYEHFNEYSGEDIKFWKFLFVLDWLYLLWRININSIWYIYYYDN